MSYVNCGDETTQPTSGGAVTAVTNCCANCVEPSLPQQWGPDLPWYIVVSTHSLDPCLWGESDHPAFGPPAGISLHLASNSITPAGSVHKSTSNSVVCMWVQLKRWCVSHVWVLQRGHSGDGCDLASTLCTYDLRKGDLFVLSWARVRRVMRGSLSSELLMYGGGVRIILLLPLVARCLETIDVCIWRMFVFMSVVVTKWDLW